MEFIEKAFDLFLHLDKHLNELIANYGTWTYLVLFAVIFCETGLVVTPILPGDSLLFAVGALSATGTLDVWTLLGLLVVAAVLGDAANYSIGRYFGMKLFRNENSRFLKREYLTRTQQFYERHGGKTIVLARFVPIVRTFAPFVAGVANMPYPRFFAYNLAGGAVWVSLFVLAGYAFGNIPIVQNNFALVAIGIVVVSLLPLAFERIKARRAAKTMQS
jgi:membrane-associated protein